MNKKSHIIINLGPFKDDAPKQCLNLKYLECKTSTRNSKKASHAGKTHNKCLK